VSGDTNRHSYPDFYVIGAAKAGTTSLWNYLRDHPQIHLGPIKEPNFFAYGSEGPNVVGPAPAEDLRARLHADTVTDADRYRQLFADAGDCQVTGEASVRYLYKPAAAARIAEARPDARLIVMLRDPVDRLRSHHTMNRSWGLEPLGLVDALAAEDERVAAGWGWDWHYVRVGRYAEQVERYLNLFGREQMLFVSYDHFRDDPAGVVGAVSRHLGIDDGYVPDTNVKAKEAYLPKSAAVDSLRRPGQPVHTIAGLLPTGLRQRAGSWLRRLNHQGGEDVPVETVTELRQRFAPDRAALESMIGPEPLWAESPR